MPLKYTTEPKVVKVSALPCMSSSGMPRPQRVNGITTPKEFSAITGAISFANALDYPMTVDLIWDLAGIKRGIGGKSSERIYILITAILELSLLHADLYKESPRQVYKDENGEYLVDKYGSIERDVDQGVIEAVKKIEENKKDTDNKIPLSVVPIDYSDHQIRYFINLLLDKSSLLSLFPTAWSYDEPLKLYGIAPYQVVKNGFNIDQKHETYMIRLIQHLFGSGVEKSIELDPQHFKETIGKLFGYMTLKHLPEYRKRLKTTKSIDLHGRHLFDLFVSSANKSGYVSSRDRSLRFFTEKSLIDFHITLFTRKKKYTGNYPFIVYEPNDTLRDIASDVFRFLCNIGFKEPKNKNIKETNNIFSFPMERLFEMDIRDVMNIMTHSVGEKEGQIWVDIGINDNRFNRVYSLITMIKSESRIGLKEYDVSTAQQAIMLQIVEKHGFSLERYPETHYMVKNKKEYREKMMKLLNLDLKEVKKRITSLTNGAVLDGYNDVTKIHLRKFSNEAEQLADDFLEVVEQKYPLVWSQALSLAKEAKEGTIGIANNKRKYGTLFHCWTHFERLIREAMKSCFNEPVYDVHDAVYSRENIHCITLEEAVFNQTGFRVDIK